MSSEVHKYIEKALENNENLFNAEVINFPNEKKIDAIKNLETNTSIFWNINDKSNADQFKAVMGVCFMFVTLILVGLYSSLT